MNTISDIWLLKLNIKKNYNKINDIINLYSKHTDINVSLNKNEYNNDLNTNINQEYKTFENRRLFS